MATVEIHSREYLRREVVVGSVDLEARGSNLTSSMEQVRE
jgi:hypothetical protein